MKMQTGEAYCHNLWVISSGLAFFLTASQLKNAWLASSHIYAFLFGYLTNFASSPLLRWVGLLHKSYSTLFLSSWPSAKMIAPAYHIPFDTLAATVPLKWHTHTRTTTQTHTHSRAYIAYHLGRICSNARPFIRQKLESIEWQDIIVKDKHRPSVRVMEGGTYSCARTPLPLPLTPPLHPKIETGLNSLLSKPPVSKVLTFWLS